MADEERAKNTGLVGGFGKLMGGALTFQDKKVSEVMTPLGPELLGLKWRNIGPNRPAEGKELTNEGLKSALSNPPKSPKPSKQDVSKLRSRHIEITKEQWGTFGITESIKEDDYVECRVRAEDDDPSKTTSYYFQPSVCFTLEYNETLNYDCLMKILRKGYTRIPILDEDSKDIVNAVLRTKDLIGIGFDKELTVREVKEKFKAHHRVNRVSKDMDLGKALDKYKNDHIHLLIVTDGDPGNAAAKCIGIVTLEDILEEVLQDEIVDESDFERIRSPEDATKLLRSLPGAPAAAPPSSAKDLV
eukprot:3631463-Prymnesium_polylepis.1